MSCADDQGCLTEQGLVLDSSSVAVTSQSSHRSLKLGGLVSLALLLVGSAVFLRKTGNGTSATSDVDEVVEMPGLGPGQQSCGDYACPPNMVKMWDLASFNKVADVNNCCKPCPMGYDQIGQKGDDIPGYGLSTPGIQTISVVECANKCNGDDACGCFKYLFSEKVCALFEEDNCNEANQTGTWNQVLTCKPSECVTSGDRGVGAGRTCVFPFIYEGTTYNSCTSVNHVNLWCATATTPEDNVIVSGNWAECDDGCGAGEPTSEDLPPTSEANNDFYSDLKSV